MQRQYRNPKRVDPRTLIVVPTRRHARFSREYVKPGPVTTRQATPEELAPAPRYRPPAHHAHSL